ncbi:MAG TPA: hypothetical protein VH575_32930, partial [Gemmataceae bacterium]
LAVVGTTIRETIGTNHHGRLIEACFRAVELARLDELSLVLAPERVQHLWEADEPIRIIRR